MAYLTCHPSNILLQIFLIPTTTLTKMSNGGGQGGGYYKYRCKHFYTYNCMNWVWVNYAACATCLVRLSIFPYSVPHVLTQGQAMGRGEESEVVPSATRFEIRVPRALDGMLSYESAWIAPPVFKGFESTFNTGNPPMGGSNSSTTSLGDFTPAFRGSPPEVFPTTMTTTDTPRPVMVTTGVHKLG